MRRDNTTHSLRHIPLRAMCGAVSCALSSRLHSCHVRCRAAVPYRLVSFRVMCGVVGCVVSSSQCHGRCGTVCSLIVSVPCVLRGWCFVIRHKHRLHLHCTTPYQRRRDTTSHQATLYNIPSYYTALHVVPCHLVSCHTSVIWVQW